MASYRDDTSPRWALMVEPHNRIREVLLGQVPRRLEQGWILIGVEDDEMYAVQRRKAIPEAPIPDDNGANEIDDDK